MALEMSTRKPICTPSLLLLFITNIRKPLAWVGGGTSTGFLQGAGGWLTTQPCPAGLLPNPSLCKQVQDMSLSDRVFPCAVLGFSESFLKSDFTSNYSEYWLSKLEPRAGLKWWEITPLPQKVKVFLQKILISGWEPLHNVTSAMNFKEDDVS